MQYSDTEKRKETIFLKERFMAAICVFIVASSLISLVLFHDQMSSFGIFEVKNDMLPEPKLWTDTDLFRQMSEIQITDHYRQN